MKKDKAKQDTSDKKKKWPFQKDKGADAEKASCGDSDDDMDKADMDDDDEDEDEDMDKSQPAVTAESLRKAMQVMGSLVEKSDARDAVLGRKLAEGTISKSERRELNALLGGGDEAPATEQFSKSLVDDENELNAEAWDAAPFLRENAELVANALGQIETRLDKSQSQQAQFNRALVKSLQGIGEASARLLERMDAVEQQPVAQAKSQRVQARALDKSFNGAAPGGAPETLSKSQTFDVLEAMQEQSYAEGRNGLSKSGVNIRTAITAYETTNNLDGSLAKEAVDFVRQQRANAN